MFKKSVDFDRRFFFDVRLSDLSERGSRIRPQKSPSLSQEKGGGASSLSILQQNFYNSAFVTGTIMTFDVCWSLKVIFVQSKIKLLIGLRILDQVSVNCKWPKYDTVSDNNLSLNTLLQIHNVLYGFLIFHQSFSYYIFSSGTL